MERCVEERKWSDEVKKGSGEKLGGWINVKTEEKKNIADDVGR